MLKRRVEHFAALILIGDGLLACLKPSREARAWRFGPEPWRSAMGAMARSPQLTRLVGAVQLGVGIWWVMRQEKNLKTANTPAL